MMVMLQVIQQKASCPHCMSALACALSVGIPGVVGASNRTDSLRRGSP